MSFVKFTFINNNSAHLTIQPVTLVQKTERRGNLQTAHLLYK
jgi:hypothetical protein